MPNPEQNKCRVFTEDCYNHEKCMKTLNEDKREERIKLFLESYQKIKADLMPREQKIIEMRFGLADGITHTLEETGKEFGVTRERIRQIEAKVIEKIRLATGFDFYAQPR